jgi:hypothetical protein
MLLWFTLPCYSGLHSHVTLVYTPMLLWFTLPCYSGLHYPYPALALLSQRSLISRQVLWMISLGVVQMLWDSD